MRLKTMGVFRGIFVVVVASFGALVFGQGGQGGGGFGGGGGNFGGSPGGAGGGSYQGRMNGDTETGPGRVIFPGKRNDTGELNSWTSKNIILTPGDKVEWKFTAKKGQVLFATATSDAFDPALAIVDSKDKVLTENDDQYEGEQTPYVSYVVQQDGDYKLLVRNYRSTSGGQFTLYTKFAPCLTVVPGNNLLETTIEEVNTSTGFYVSLLAEKGKFYGILRSPSIFKEANAEGYFVRLIGPSGVSDLDFKEFKSNDSDTVFEAKQTGNYLVQYSIRTMKRDKPPTLGFSVSEIKVQKFGPEDEVRINLLPGQQRIFQMETKKGTALYSKVTFDDGMANTLSFDAKIGTKKNYYNGVGYQWIPKTSSNPSEGFRYFGSEGTLNYVVCNFLDKPGTLVMQNGAKIPELNSLTTVSDHLGIGEARFFWLSGSKLDMQHIVASSKQMELTMDFIDYDLFPSHFENVSSHAPDALFNYDKAKRFLVILTSAGRGGSGDYSLHFDKILPNKITMGANTLITKSSSGMSVFEATLEKDVYYEMVIKAPEGYAQIADPDGMPVNSGVSPYDNIKVYRFKSVKAGVHRITFSPSQVGGKFRFDKAVIPTIDK